MTDRPHPSDETVARGALRLTRGITAAWWYTVSGIVFFDVLQVLLWTTILVGVFSPGVIAFVGFGGLVWCGTGVLLLLDYRTRIDSDPVARWRRAVTPLAVALLYGAASAALTGIWVLAVLPVALSAMMLNWAPGVRLRVMIVATAVLIGLWIIDSRFVFGPDGALAGVDWELLGFYSVLLPAMTVLSLWWWDVIVTLDRARASEARLAATQERLRVATDVHDLQGHHLQVIALQLELAERLMSRDPDAALEQLRAGRASVDEARQGRRDLATRFRSVALADEMANAVDLLRAAGIAADASIDADADLAPADVIGPVVRETTTNVLRHGGGGWARLSLRRDASAWRYEISNDVMPGAVIDREGSGLTGLARRAADAGGTLDLKAERQDFTVTMTVPASQGGSR